MKVDIVSLFPEMFKGPFDESIIKRAQEKGLVEIKIHDLRKWGEGERKTVDDRPYGGGVGMLIRVDIVEKALEELKTENCEVILLDAGGEKFNQKIAGELSSKKHLILLAGHYEGFDYRVHEHLADRVLSIGDYVLTGGELPAMVLTDTIVRLIPSVLEKEQATEIESFSESNLLEYPQYTRPEDYQGWKVPEILLSGNHGEITKWRNTEAIQKTKRLRPDLR